jgi:hypothetical protein
VSTEIWLFIKFLTITMVLFTPLSFCIVDITSHVSYLLILFRRKITYLIFGISECTKLILHLWDIKKVMNLRVSPNLVCVIQVFDENH